MSKRLFWCVLLAVPLLIGPERTRAVEHGDVIQKKDGTWVFKNMEDPVLKFMRDTGWITTEKYFTVASQTGKNWIEPADAILNVRREVDWRRYLKTGLHLPDWIDLGLEQRTRFESVSHPWRVIQVPGNGATDSQIPLRSRVRFRLGGNGPVRFLFEGQDSRSFLISGEPGNFRDSTTVNEFDALQLFGALKLANVLGTGLRTDFHFGRWTSDFGRRRLISRNNFRNTTNSFDGFHWQIGQEQLWRLRAFVVEPVIRNTEQLDHQNSNSLFWGTYFQSHHFPWFQMDAYYLGLNDRRVANVANHRTYSTFGGRLYKDPMPGEPHYEIETSWQIGTLGVADHFAYLQHLDLGYTFDLPWTPRLVFHYDYASGDRQPGDGQNGSFDTLFGSRNFEYTRTGIWGPFYRTNLQTPGWRVIVTPTPSLLLEVKHRVWFLAQSKDFFGQSGLRDPTGQSGTSLGQDVELRAQWAVNSNLDFDFGYAHWFKGSYFDSPIIIAEMPAGGNKDSDYFFAAVRVRIWKGMPMKQRFLAWCLFVLESTAVTPAFAEQVLVAVAANFVPPFHEVAMEFEKSTGHHVQVAAGSSGNFYSQIKNGAPFDVFFSADTERPKLLEEGGFGVKDSRFTYALGRLVLWSLNADLVKGEETLSSKNFTHLAIANPKTAPYGLAAMQAMQALRIWEKLQPRNVIVIGENLGQTMGFIESGHAQLGFVALSQVMASKFKGRGSRWDVPSNLHEPIQQDAILLTKGKDNPGAKALMKFMSGPQAKAIIERYGYYLK